MSSRPSRLAAAVIVISLLAGVLLALAPADIRAQALALIAAVALPLGALRTVAGGVACWRARERLLAVLLILLGCFLALLGLAAAHRLVS